MRGRNLKYSRSSLRMFYASGSGFIGCLDAKPAQKSCLSSVWVDGERGGRRKKFGKGDSSEDEGSTQEGTAAKMLVQNEEGGQAGEYRFESEEDRSVGGGNMLLGPALDGKGSGSGEEAGNGQGNDETRSNGEVRPSAQWQGDCHDNSSYADLESCELADGDPIRGVGQGEEVGGEGYCACKGKEIPRTDADEEVSKGGSGRGGKEQKAREGKESSDSSGPARTRCVGRSKRGNDGEERNEDDYKSSDKGGFGGSGTSEAGGLELIAGCEKEADNKAGVQSVAADVAELAVVHDGKSDKGQCHTEKIEEKRRGVPEGVLDEDEGAPPDEDYGQEKKMREGGVRDTANHPANSPARRCRRFFR